MKKEQNAFTLVELLAVIVVLAIVLIIAVPGVLSIINKTKDSAYDRQVDMIKNAAKNYVTANTITWLGDNPKSTLVTLDMLQSGGYLDKKIIDPRNKKEILCANVLVSKDNKNKITYDVDMTCNDVQPITPRVGSGMIPIVYDGTNWRKADVSNKNFAWFNYGNQQWANVATITEDVRQTLLDAPDGTVVLMDKINTMFTWIPRFKYKLFNVDGTVSPVGNKNLAGDYMIDIKFETASTTKSTGTQNGQWLTHPAFTSGNEEIEGFWIAKFETGYLDATTTTEASQNTTDATKVVIKPNQYSWRGISIGNAFHLSQNMATVTTFGLSNDTIHVERNLEWGAVAYLTSSKYGKTGNPEYGRNEKEVTTNNYNQFVTGCGTRIITNNPSSSCHPYDTSDGQAASTTGNITGVYDLNGSATEYIMGVITDDSGKVLVGPSQFDPTELAQLAQDGKYLDTYLPGEQTDFSRGKLGDATIEMGPFQTDKTSWYNDIGKMVGKEISSNGWFIRGGRFDDKELSGIFAFNGWWTGAGAATFRIVMN